jgi:hypothetical protein
LDPSSPSACVSKKWEKWENQNLIFEDRGDMGKIPPEIKIYRFPDRFPTVSLVGKWENNNSPLIVTEGRANSLVGNLIQLDQTYQRQPHEKTNICDLMVQKNPARISSFIPSGPAIFLS